MLCCFERNFRFRKLSYCFLRKKSFLQRRFAGWWLWKNVDLPCKTTTATRIGCAPACWSLGTFCQIGWPSVIRCFWRSPVNGFRIWSISRSCANPSISRVFFSSTCFLSCSSGQLIDLWIDSSVGASGTELAAGVACELSGFIRRLVWRLFVTFDLLEYLSDK